jgi:hypothetical protein
MPYDVDTRLTTSRLGNQQQRPATGVAVWGEVSTHQVAGCRPPDNNACRSQCRTEQKKQAVAESNHLIAQSVQSECASGGCTVRGEGCAERSFGQFHRADVHSYPSVADNADVSAFECHPQGCSSEDSYCCQVLADCYRHQPDGRTSHSSAPSNAADADELSDQVWWE